VAAPFSIVSGSSYALGAGASQTVTVRFSPTAAQSYTQNVTFTGGAGAPRTMTGTGIVTVPATPTNPNPGSLSSPGPTIPSNTVTLSWNASTGATYYGLGVRDIASGVLVVSTNVKGISYVASLSAGKQYRWNVAACNNAGCSSYTTVLYFRTQ
jgi:hypothetical protein